MIETEKFRVDFKELYNTAPCGYLCSLPNGKIFEVNNRFLEFTNYERSEVINQKRLVDFLTAAGKIYYDTSYNVILKLKGEVKELSFSFVKKDGTKIPVLINSNDIKNEKGEYLYTQSTIFDISQRKNYEEQLIAAKKMADHLTDKLSLVNRELEERNKILEQKTDELNNINEELETLNYVASHDLKAPMNEIEGHFNYLKSKLVTEDEYMLESIEFIDDGIQQFQNTVIGLNKAIKLRKTEASIGKVDLLSIFNELKPTWKNKIKELDGKLILNLGDEKFILGNEIFVKSILQNIVGNAIKYHSSDRKIHILIEAVEDKEFIYLKVEDNGIGMNLVLNESRIFSMFSRFNDHTEGTGMGLYMTKKMIEYIKGRITIESQLNKGSVFTLSFRKYSQSKTK